MSEKSFKTEKQAKCTEMRDAIMDWCKECCYSIGQETKNYETHEILTNGIVEFSVFREAAG